jgi:hypothetical protein
MRRQLANLHERHPLTDQEAFDPIRMPAAITPSEQELAMHLAPILFRECGHVDHTPHLLFAGVGTEEHGHQLARIEAIRLGPPPSAIDFDAR